MLYYFAKMHPELEFLVAYSGTGKNLNGYSNQEMADMFFEATQGKVTKKIKISKNIVFEEEFSKLIKI